MPNFKQGLTPEDMKPKDLTDNGRCTQCGECCTNRLPISDNDIAAIRKYIKAHRIRPVNHVPAILAGPTLDLVCPFLDHMRPDKKCLIYPVRPLICRLFTCRTYVDKTAFQDMLAGLQKDPGTMKELINNRTRNVRDTFYPKTDNQKGRKP